MRTFVKLMLAASFVAASCAAQSARAAPSFHYHFVDLDTSGPPDMIGFFPAHVTNQGWVYGTGFFCPDLNNLDTCVAKVAVFRLGHTIALADGGANDANEAGLVGGAVVTDPVNYISQAALFKDGKTTLIPPLEGEGSSYVLKVTNTGVALVESDNATTYQSTFYLYDRGRVTSLNLGSGQVAFLRINDRLQVAGTVFGVPGKGDRAFRFDTRTQTMTLLDPLPTEPDAWGQDINARGDVLGYSFVSGAIERIGAWRGTTFQTAFVEGTPQFRTVSNKLVWNERGLIVISATNDRQAYLVPAPGERLTLSDRVDQSIGKEPWITGENEVGDLIGFDIYGTVPTFLLQRAPGNASAAKASAARLPSVALKHLPRRLVAFARGDMARGAAMKAK